MSSLIKLLTINLYALTEIENYEEPQLPIEVNAMEYQKVCWRLFLYFCLELCFFFSISQLIGVPTKNFIADGLKNFLPVDKCFKSNLLMPYGILIDAFMIANKSGEAKALEEFFNKETAEFEADSELFNKLNSFFFLVLV